MQIINKVGLSTMQLTSIDLRLTVKLRKIMALSAKLAWIFLIFWMRHLAQKCHAYSFQAATTSHPPLLLVLENTEWHVGRACTEYKRKTKRMHICALEVHKTEVSGRIFKHSIYDGSEHFSMILSKNDHEKCVALHHRKERDIRNHYRKHFLARDKII